MDRLRVCAGHMFITVGSTVFLYEPAFTGPEPTGSITSVLSHGTISKVPAHATDQEAAFVRRLQTERTDRFHAHSAAHLQFGGAYPLVRNRDATFVALLRTTLRELDPHNILNPGTSACCALAPSARPRSPAPRRPCEQRC